MKHNKPKYKGVSWEDSSMVEGVPDKHEDLHLDPCYPYKKLGKEACAYSSSIRRWR